MSLMKSVLLNFSYVLLLLNNEIIQAEAFDDCSSDVWCPGPLYCCERKYPDYNVCQSDCLGESCNWNSDCAPDECCDSNKCSSDCTLAGGIIAAIVIGVIITIAVPTTIVACRCCHGAAAASASRRPVQHGFIMIQQPAAGMTVVASHNTQGQAQYYPPTVQPNPYYNNFNIGQVGPPDQPLAVPPPPYYPA